MPTYQYACTECGHAFEQVQSFSDEALTTCPECQGRLRKVFNAVGVVFKGSGFYRTDSRSAGSSSDPGANGSSPDKTGKAETSGTTGTSSSPATTQKTSSPSGGSGSSGGSTAGAGVG